jgi:serine/threonine protein kinase
MGQICTTTADLHKTHTHGDLKLENYLFREEKDGSIKTYMTDLQTAKPIGERYPGWGGTPSYQPPEAFRRYFFTHDIDKKVDDWALGIMGIALEFPTEGEAFLNKLEEPVRMYYLQLLFCEDAEELEEKIMPSLPKEIQEEIAKRWRQELGNTHYGSREHLVRSLNIAMDVLITKPLNETLQPLRDALKKSSDPYYSKVLYPLLHPDINQRINAAEAARRIQELQTGT